MATIQTGGTQSNTARRLSTATRIRADKAWIGWPSAGGAAGGGWASKGGRTSTGASFAGTSLIFGGLSTGIANIGLPNPLVQMDEAASRLLVAHIEAYDIARGVAAVDMAIGQHGRGPAFASQHLGTRNGLELDGRGLGDNQLALLTQRHELPIGHHE